MAKLTDVQQFVDAGWDAKKSGARTHRAHASNKKMLAALHIDDEWINLSLIGLSTEQPLEYFIVDDEHATQAMDALIRLQPELTHTNFREVIHQMLLAGATVETEINGERMNVTLEDADDTSAKKPGLRGLFGSASKMLRRDREPAPTPAQTRDLVYQQGSEHGPNAPFGHYTLTTDLNGDTIHIERRLLGKVETWTAQSHPDWRAALQRAIAGAPLPQQSLDSFPAGASLRIINIDDHSAMVEHNAATRDPQWAPLFGVLDAVLLQVCPENLAAPHPQPLPQGWITNVRPANL